MWNQLRWKWAVGALVVLLAMPGAAKTKHPAKKGKAKSSAPVVSRAQMELSERMVRDSYSLGVGLDPKRRVALMTRLLYTMRSDVMAPEKKQWAEELFVLAQKLPRNEAVEVDSARNSAIATAAARLAVYDTDRALDLLDTLPAENGNQAGPRVMAARLVFAGYMQHHPSAGAPVLLEHAKKWGAHGGFPYSASGAALGRLRPNEAAAEEFFRQVLTVFERGHEGLYGVKDFASLLEQAVAMEAISEESAEEAGKNILGQLKKLSENPDIALTEDQKGLIGEALENVRVSAPKSYDEARKVEPGLFGLHATKVTAQVEIPKVDLGLQAAFRELAQAMREGRSSEQIRESIGRGVQLVNDKYKGGSCADCASPDAQSWALISLAGFAAPMTIASQLNAIQDPFWHAYFLAIAAQQVGQPTRVADPTARKVVGKEEAEPE